MAIFSLAMVSPTLPSESLDPQLLGAQSYKAVVVDASVEGGPLRVAGKSWSKGYGAHAAGEFPIAVPPDAVAFRGAVGVDDAAGDGNGLVRFRILDGESVLWESPPCRAGEPATSFDVSLVPGRHHVLYLQSDDLGQRDFDHANWLDPVFAAGTPASPRPVARVVQGSEYGLKPGTGEDQSPAMRRALAALRSSPGATLLLEKGVYHFHEAGALKRHFHVSNHDQPTWHPVSIPVVDQRDITIDGQDSLFLFQGTVLPLLIQDSTGIRIRGISIDSTIPHHAGGKIVSMAEDGYVVEIDPMGHPHTLTDGWFTFRGDGWEARDHGVGIVFSGQTGEIVAGTSDFNYRGPAREVAPHRYHVGKDLTRTGIKPGDSITFRMGAGRPHPAITLYRAHGIEFHATRVHSSHGMGWLAQRSSGILISGGGCYPRLGIGRAFSTGADATHFSNCRGSIRIENARFEGMMDDAINVHATCLRIDALADERTALVSYRHPQSIGFETILPGEKARVIRARSLEPGEPVAIESVRRIDNRTLEIRATTAWPPGTITGDALESADWHPAVVFRRNVVRHNRARGALFTTPEPILVEENTFDTIAGSAILLAGDANGWFESGACRDVLIRKNTFRNNLTSRFQFTEAILSFYPEVPEPGGAAYHRDIRIEDNDFETFDVPLLFAIASEGIRFTGNRVRYNRLHPSWGSPPFILRATIDFTARDNRVIDADGREVRWGNGHVRADAHCRDIRVDAGS